jgi:hypothetical protein
VVVLVKLLRLPQVMAGLAAGRIRITSQQEPERLVKAMLAALPLVVKRVLVAVEQVRLAVLLARE